MFSPIHIIYSGQKIFQGAPGEVESVVVIVFRQRTLSANHHVMINVSTIVPFSIVVGTEARITRRW